MDELLRQIDIPAMEQAVSEQYKSQIRRRWELPADYWMLLERCCGLRTVWSNDTYEALELWGLDTLVKGQEGYAYNPVEQKVMKDWDEHLVVIASDAGDPYCLDLRRNDTAVFWAEHGAGTWDFQPAFDCLVDFLESVLDVPKTQEYLRSDQSHNCCRSRCRRKRLHKPPEQSEEAKALYDEIISSLILLAA